MGGKTSVDFAAIGRRACEMRRELGLSQRELADRVGVTTSFIGHIERAEKVPSLQTMARLSLELDVALDWLVLGEKGNCARKSRSLFDELTALLASFGGND